MCMGRVRRGEAGRELDTVVGPKIGITGCLAGLIIISWTTARPWRKRNGPPKNLGFSFKLPAASDRLSGDLAG